jgi:hypothetical protein
VQEWFIDGTQPGARNGVDPAGLLYSARCGTWQVDPVKAELGPSRWDDDIAAWVARARRGTGIRGPYGSITAFWFGEHSWGGPLYGACAAPKEPGGGGKDTCKKHCPPLPEGTPPPQNAPAATQPRVRRRI